MHLARHSVLVLAIGALAAVRAHATAASDVEKYLAGLSSWSADFTQTIDGRAGQGVAQRRGQVLPAAAREIPLGLCRALAAAGARRRQGDLVLRQGFAASQRAQDGCDACEHTGRALVGDRLGSEQFDIKALPDDGGLHWFQLLPKHPDTDFQLVRIGFDKDGELASMFLADKLNQITQLTFTHPVKNPKLIPDLFTFSPPPGVDVIGRDSK